MVVGFVGGWPENMGLRPWQDRACREYLQRNKTNFLVVATPGAGKTFLALRIAHDLLVAGKVRRIVIVCPTDHLKVQWARAANKVGIHLDPTWLNRHGSVAADMHGVVVTYHQVGSNPDIHRKGCAQSTLVIFDEIHHAGTGNAWGDTLRHAFDPATRRLSLSGTPFRSDNAPIPYVTYDATGQSVADFTYGYGAALADGVCRPIIFPSFEGNMEWFSGGEVLKASFSDELNEAQASERLKTALDPRGAWISEVLHEAHAKLMRIRGNGHPHAGGLVITRTQEHARQIAALLAKIGRCQPAVAISEDPNASEVIRAFDKGSDPWLVAVRMVSEGVDIPRLRVGVYATNVATEMAFRQAVGRLLRMMQGISDDQCSFLFMPKEDVLVEYAKRIREERNHALDQDDDGGEEPQAPRDPKRGPSQPGLYYAISATATPDDVIFDEQALTRGQIDEAQQVAHRIGFGFSAEILARAFIERDKLRPSVVLTPEPMQPQHQQTTPLHERKKSVSNKVNGLVRQLSYATEGELHYSDIWVLLTKRDGVRHSEATLEQHIKRAECLQTWIKEARDGNRYFA